MILSTEFFCIFCWLRRGCWVGIKITITMTNFSATKFYCCKDVLKHLIVREILNWKWWYHDCDDVAMDHNFLWWSNASWFLMMDQMHHDYDDDLMHHDCDDDQIDYRGSDVSRVIDNSKWISLELSMTRCPLATAWRCQIREAPWNQQLQLLGLPSASSTPPPFTKRGNRVGARGDWCGIPWPLGGLWGLTLSP